MSIVSRLIALTRYSILNRQLKEIERIYSSLPPNNQRGLSPLLVVELDKASKLPFPHLYGSSPERRYQPWGDATEIAFERARSENPQMRMRGVALWLTVAFYETSNSEFGEHQTLHDTTRDLIQRITGIVPRTAGLGAEQVA